MKKRQPSTFERVFTPRELFQRPALGVLPWTVLSAVLLFLGLIDLFLMVDLLDGGGRLDLEAQQAAILAERVDDEALASSRELANNGLLATVYRTRDKFWNEAVATLYRHSPWARENGTTLLVLVTIGLILALLRGLCLSRGRRLSENAALDVATRLRRTLHRQALRLGPGDLRDVESSTALELFTVEVDRVKDGVATTIHRLARYPLELATLLAFALAVDWRITLICLVPLVFCWVLLHRESQRFEYAHRLAEARAETELRPLAESLRKTRLVRGYGMEEVEREEFGKQLDRFRRNAATVKQAELWSRRAALGLVTVCTAIVLFLVGTKVLHPGENGAEFNLSGALALLVCFGGMHPALSGLWYLGRDRTGAGVAADKIFRYLGRIPEVGQAVGAKFLQPVSKSIRFDGVTYSLNEHRKVLDSVDLRIAAGERVAVVSIDPLESRALLYLLPRFIEPQSGRVLFDREDIAWATLESLRAETVYVGGTDPLFTGSVLRNVTCGESSYSLQDATEAAKTAHAHNFVLKLPQGYETVLGEHGESLDPGQSFRIGLARAVLRDPAVAIIEEPVETLDADTKSLLDDAYDRICRERTVVFLPSRLSTVRRCDRVILLHRGHVEATGKHADLVKQSAIYRHWEYIRFNEFRHEVEPVA